MIDEIEAAAKWWSDKLGGGHFQDNGEAMGSAMATLARAHTDTPTEEQLAAFRERFREITSARITLRGCWLPSDPMYGSCTEGRCHHVDYGPDALLRDAAEFAGIDTGRFPIKTTMWISPGSVRVACGYGRGPQTIFGTDPPNPAQREHA